MDGYGLDDEVDDHPLDAFQDDLVGSQRREEFREQYGLNEL